MKNAAELAWAAYGYYDLMTSDTNPLFIKLKNENSQANSNEDFSKKETTLIDIMDSSYKNYEVYCFNPKTKKEEKVGKLGGDFTPTQAKRFFERYDILIHQPNTESGFSATLFQNKESKEYTLAIRGTESHHNFKYNRVAS